MSGPQSAETERFVDGIGTFLRERVGAEDLRVTDAFRHIEGFSWETWAVSIAWTEAGGDERERQVIVRRAPQAGLLGPYEVGPQWELNQALYGVTGIPVPEPLWIDLEGSATGRPLYVMARVEAAVPAQWNTHKFFPDDEARHAMGRQFAALGARIHEVDLEVLPARLRGVGPAAARGAAGEVAYWEDVYRRDAVEPVPVLEWAFAWLARNGDATSERTTLVHGDFRIGNFMVADERIVAMLDWELAHIGDPVEDLAFAAVRLYRGRTGDASGLLPVDDWLAAYGEAAGWEVPPEAFKFWTVFGCTRAAVTLVTASRLFSSGATRDLRYAALGHQVHYLLRHILEELRSPSVADARS